MRIIKTKMTDQSCQLCYLLDEGSGLEYRVSCCNDDGKGQGAFRQLERLILEYQFNFVFNKFNSVSDQQMELPCGVETFLVLVIIIVVLAVIVINFLIISLIVLKRLEHDI